MTLWKVRALARSSLGVPDVSSLSSLIPSESLRCLPPLQALHPLQPILSDLPFNMRSHVHPHLRNIVVDSVQPDVMHEIQVEISTTDSEEPENDPKTDDAAPADDAQPTRVFSPSLPDGMVCRVFMFPSIP